MSPELEQRLYSEFPLLYRMRHLENPDMCSGWKGIRCNDGWFDLIRTLSREIVDYSHQHHLDPMVVEVLRRGGALRMVLDDGADDHIRKLCREALEKSCRICEICGESGEFVPDQPYNIRVCCSKHAVEKDDSPLTEEEVSRLRRFNQKMFELQREIVDEGHRHVKVLSGRVADPLDPLDDFEIEAKVTFCLREDDSEFREDDDNILTGRKYYIPKDSAEESHFYSAADWGISAMHVGIENHCYIFHDLYDHSWGPGRQQLSFRDILRIGQIWIDIEIQAQIFRDAGGNVDFQSLPSLKD
ncbi:MAG: hypothetical protein GJU73_03310 [Ferrovum sp.]|jgi:hypothetical protein|uniref:hypothetical protein n=1 Tax=Ferrovum sp. TaxID=2609467 RepID=UPI0026205B4E|nr:hypothetical protein [Ferrovum sp.]MBW8066451.1 hypothetical protein [Ferrovum sp.]